MDSATLYGMDTSASHELPSRVPVVSTVQDSSRTLPAVWDGIVLLASLAASVYLQQRVNWGSVSRFDNLFQQALYDRWSLSAFFLLSLSVLLLAHRKGAGWCDLEPPDLLKTEIATLWSGVVAVLLLGGTIYLLVGKAPPRAMLFTTVGLPTIALGLKRFAWYYAHQRRNAKQTAARNVLILGVGHAAKILRDHMVTRPELGYRFRGFIDLGGTPEPCEVDDLEVLGGPDFLTDQVKSLFIDEVFLTAPCEPLTMRALKALASTMGITVRMALAADGDLKAGQRIQCVGDCTTVILYTTDISAVDATMKHAVDIFLSVIAVVLLIPLALVIVIAIKLDSPGPALYVSTRLGLRGRPFRCLKFRTMVSDAEERLYAIRHLNQRTEILFKASNDPRITRVGAILRKYSLDELPQFINVLRGEMSIVGPRPPLRDEVDKYRNGYLRRLSVMPGITGLWQVGARGDPSFDSYISFDIAYIENWSIWLDLVIIARTVGVLLSGTGT